MLKLDQKKNIVSSVAKLAQNAQSIVAVDYRGLKVTDMVLLRVEARKNNVHLQVVRNTLAKRALAGTTFECLEKALKGPVLLAFAKNEVSASARLIRDFAKTNDKLKVKGLALNNQLYGPEQLDAIAKLPTKEEAISKLMSVMQAPIVKLARTIAEPKAKLVRTIMAVRDKKQAEGG